MSTAAHRVVAASSLPFAPCTCGEAHPHEVMRRTTADGISIHLESDGKVLGLMGRSLRDVPVRRPRTAESHRLALKAGRLFMNAVGFYGADEIGKLYADACEAARRGVEIRGVQRERKNAPPEAPPLAWTTTRADRDGKPTERQARLPRLLWPGMAVSTTAAALGRRTAATCSCTGRSSTGARSGTKRTPSATSPTYGRSCVRDRRRVAPQAPREYIPPHTGATRRPHHGGSRGRPRNHSPPQDA